MSTVLVVEDNPVEARVVVGLLEAQGLTARAVSSGAEALAVLDDEAPEVVVTDLIMAGMTGLELVEKLRHVYPNLPVILMTAFGSVDVAMEALKRGAASYVAKARLREELPETVERTLALARERRERRRALRFLTESETRFELENDETLIAPVVSYLQEAVSSMGVEEEARLMQVGVALQEALRNAMHHGNLEVGSELRGDGSQAYYALVERRLGESPYRERRVRLSSRVTRSRAIFVVRDEGPGFDPGTVADPTAAENLLSAAGRGLYLIWTFMDEVRFNPAGNEITLVKRLSSERDG